MLSSANFHQPSVDLLCEENLFSKWQLENDYVGKLKFINALNILRGRRIGVKFDKALLTWKLSIGKKIVD